MTDFAATPPSTDRVVRVFISGTFLDLREEREILATKIFPQLRSRFRDRGIDIVDVDLRWGITDEQAGKGEILRLCRRLINECSHFVGIIGGRYGWIPDATELAHKANETARNLGPGTGLVEIEMLHFRTLDSGKKANTTYYFREPTYAPPYLEYDSRDESPKLERLKTAIRRSGCSVRQNYPDPETLGRWVLEDLSESIEMAFPQREASDHYDPERAAQAAYAATLRKAYVRRAADFERLYAHVDGDGPPLVIEAPSGMGKSALMANWTCEFQTHRPDAHLFQYFVGATPASRNIDVIRRSIVEWIRDRYGLTASIPEDNQELAKDLPWWLQKAAAHGRFVIVIDGLNHAYYATTLTGALSWLPGTFPSNARVMLSVQPPADEEQPLNLPAWDTYQLPPLRPEDKEALIKGFLAPFGRQLGAELTQLLVNASQSESPQHLKLLLEELRLIGHHDTLKQQILEYLEADDFRKLIDKTLERLDHQFEPVRAGLVRDAMSYLFAARGGGLRESELLELLGGENGPLPHSVWMPLREQLTGILVNRADECNLSNIDVRVAIARRYLGTPFEYWEAVRSRLLDYFESQAISERTVIQATWQLYRLWNWDALKRQVTDLERFRLLNKSGDGRDLFYKCWKELEDRFDMDEALREMLAAHLRGPDSAKHDEELLEMLRSCCLMFGHIGTAVEAAEALANVCRELRGQVHLSTGKALKESAYLKVWSGAVEGWHRDFEEALGIAESLAGPDSELLAEWLDSAGTAFFLAGRRSEAESYLRECVAVTARSADASDLRLANRSALLAYVLAEQEQPDKAWEVIELAQRALETLRRIYLPESAALLIPVQSLVMSYYRVGDYRRADSMVDETARINLALMRRECMEAYVRPHIANILQRAERVCEFCHTCLKIKEHVGDTGSVEFALIEILLGYSCLALGLVKGFKYTTDGAVKLRDTPGPWDFLLEDIPCEGPLLGEGGKDEFKSKLLEGIANVVESLRHDKPDSFVLLLLRHCLNNAYRYSDSNLNDGTTLVRGLIDERAETGAFHDGMVEWLHRSIDDFLNLNKQQEEP